MITGRRSSVVTALILVVLMELVTCLTAWIIATVTARLSLPEWLRVACIGVGLLIGFMLSMFLIVAPEARRRKAREQLKITG